MTILSKEQMDEQNEKLDLISSRVVSLKNISQTLHNELSDQAELLDEVGNEMDRVDSKMNTIMIKLRKILRLSDGILLYRKTSRKVPWGIKILKPLKSHISKSNCFKTIISWNHFRFGFILYWS